MPILHALVLGLVQGLSEFLPVSSSGHLVLVPRLLGWDDFGGRDSLEKAFDVALHLGTFVGAAAYFRADLARYAAAALRSLSRRRVETTDERMAWLLLLSALPAAAVGGAFSGTIERHTGSPILIGTMLVLFGLVLLAADTLGGKRPDDDFRARDALLMGATQALALQPGVSRSGATITMARWLRFERESAVRISFLMSLPIILGAGLFKALDVASGEGVPSGFAPAFVWGMVAAAVSGFLAVAWLLRFVRTRTLVPFVVYRAVLGVSVVVVFATNLR